MKLTIIKSTAVNNNSKKAGGSVVVFIGGGNMAEALIKGMLQGSKLKLRIDVLVSEPKEERREYLKKAYGIETTASNKEAAAAGSIIVLAVKPQNMTTVLDEIAAVVTAEKTVVSIAAGITLSYLQTRLKTKKLARVMPNTPALIQKGMSVMSLCDNFDDRDIALVREIFMSVGNLLTMPEKYMNAVTALSGSGPAFLAFYIEAMIEAGIRIGLTGEQASELAIQTFIGTAWLLATGMPPGKLREMVTSPGGTTAEGLKVFENRGLKNITIEAINAAIAKAEELGRRE